MDAITGNSDAFRAAGLSPEEAIAATLDTACAGTVQVVECGVFLPGSNPARD